MLTEPWKGKWIELMGSTAKDAERWMTLRGKWEGKKARKRSTNLEGFTHRQNPMNSRGELEESTYGFQELNQSVSGRQLMPVNVGDGALASIRRGRTNGGRTPADGGFRTRWPELIGRNTKEDGFIQNEKKK
mgnify:CR=1 FL=1